MVPRVAVVGAGRVGVEVAKHILLMDLADVVLIDVRQRVAEGEALDLSHMAALLGISRSVEASGSYEAIESCDLVVIAAGQPRKAGMSREELVCANARIVKGIAEAAACYAPHSVIIVVTNPVDTLTYVAWRFSGFDRWRVMGFGSMLDSARLAYAVSKILGVSPSSINSLVLGEHGEAMAPMLRLSTVFGTPLTQVLTPEQQRAVVDEVRRAGSRIIELRGWSANHAPGAGVALLARAVLRDERRVLPVSVVLNGEYGYRGIPLSVPAVIGKGGVLRIIELELENSERRALERAAAVIKEMLRCLEELGIGTSQARHPSSDL